MKRHTLDGAEILRQTPDVPTLAPVVAFEHHLRIDGSGYPAGVTRASLNVGTMLCSIADVYDAMRSQRRYQQAFPTERILEVLKRNDGTAVRSAPGPAVRPADRHLPGRHDRPARHRRGRRRTTGLCAGSVSPARAGARRPRRRRGSSCRTISISGKRADDPQRPKSIVGAARSRRLPVRSADVDMKRIAFVVALALLAPAARPPRSIRRSSR